jgi:aspartate-semialdehyde dehydrogenase
MRLAIIGATGLVGKTLLKVLQERACNVTGLLLVASEASAGQVIEWNKLSYPLITLEEALAAKPTVAIFSAGSELSLIWAPQFVAAGAIVIDNSAAWRLEPACRLIVPEVNGDLLTSADRLIANPNCSTIQMVMALAPLHQVYKIKRLVISTYQAVTGSGKSAVDQLLAERQGFAPTSQVYAYPIDLNLIPQIGDFEANGYSQEEMKLINEPRKILGDSSIQITATAVRVPVLGGHSMSVNARFEKDFTLEEVIGILDKAPGLVVQDWKRQQYPMPLSIQNRDEVFVGRIRKDQSQPCTLDLWIVADNLRKGAATNAIQIVEYLQFHRLIK